MFSSLVKTYFFLNENHAKEMKIFRYIVSGGMATVTNVVSLYIFTDILGVYYVISAVLSYLTSFVVSFSMQKYWTFSGSSKDRIGHQIVFYLVITLVNLGLNASAIYLLVNYVGIYYLLAQIVISLIIAIESFFAYKFVFNLKENIRVVKDDYNPKNNDLNETIDHYSKS